MDRSRETRKSNTADSNGLSRRRQRGTPLRGFPEDDGQVDLQQETVRLRDRGSKKEKDGGFLNRSKRRRGERLVQGISREEGEETTEDSFGDEDDYEIDEVGVSRMLPPNGASLSVANHDNHQRKGLSQPRLSRQVPAMKGADEMIGVSVPRKARSASVKRSHESWLSGSGGFVEDQNHRRASASPVSWSVETGSPSSSTVSVRNKTKSSGPKTRLPKASKTSSSIPEDIEFEIAEVLYGLTKQSQGSKRDKNTENGSQNLALENRSDINHECESLPTSKAAQISNLAKDNSSVSDPSLGVASKKQKVEADTTVVHSSSYTSAVEDGNVQLAKMSGFNEESGKAFHEKDDPKVASGLPDLQDKAIKLADTRPAIEEAKITREMSVSPEEESAMSTKLEVDIQDSIITKVPSTASQVQSGEKFKIDLMAPPPMEQDGFDLSLDPKTSAQDVKMKTEDAVKHDEHVERFMKEAAVKELEEKWIKTRGEKCELKLDLEKQGHDSGNDNSTIFQQKEQYKATISKLETTAQSSTVPLPIAIAGWPSGFPPLRYMPPFHTVVPMDGATQSSTALQPAHFMPSQSRLKRCATHHYIARNIHMHQQIMKMNHFWPAVTGSAALCGAKSSNLNAMPSGENIMIGNPLHGSFPVMNLSKSQDKGQAVANFHVSTWKDKSFEGVDTAQKNQLVLQQSPQPAPAGNLMHGPAYVFSLSQHQPSVAATANQTEPSKSAASVSNVSLSGKAIAGVATNSPALPSVAAAMSFNYPNLVAANETPYLTVLPNNGYPFPVSNHVGNPPAFRGVNPAQALPFYNSSFYSSQMLHPSQLPQQQSPSRPPVQSVHQNARTLSGSSSSCKQPQTQQSRGAQVSGNNFLTSTSMQPQTQHVSSHQTRTHGTEMNRESAGKMADTRSAHSHHTVHGQNFAVPLQPSFALMPSMAVGGHCSEKQQQQRSQEKSSKSGMEVVPSQAFAVSFASFKGSNTASNLNFSSVAQNPVILQSLPDMTRQGYQVVSAPQAIQKKNHQVSEGKAGGSSTIPDEGKKPTLGKSSMSVGQTLVFDNSARTLSFVSPSHNGNWPSPSVISTTNSPIPIASPKPQQQQLLQLQKLHNFHHEMQQQQHPTGAARSKTLTPDSLPLSSIGAKFSNNASVFSQAANQSNSSPQNPQWKNSPRIPASQAPLTSNTVKNIGQQQARAPEGHNQISFGGNSKSATTTLEQHVPTSNQSPSVLVARSLPTGGNLRTTSAPALQSQQSENSSTANGQKSSPVCGRTVPSILSACPSHLSELKY